MKEIYSPDDELIIDYTTNKKRKLVKEIYPSDDEPIIHYKSNNKKKTTNVEKCNPDCDKDNAYKKVSEEPTINNNPPQSNYSFSPHEKNSTVKDLLPVPPHENNSKKEEQSDKEVDLKYTSSDKATTSEHSIDNNKSMEVDIAETNDFLDLTECDHHSNNLKDVPIISQNVRPIKNMGYENILPKKIGGSKGIYFQII